MLDRDRISNAYLIILFLCCTGNEISKQIVKATAYLIHFWFDLQNYLKRFLQKVYFAFVTFARMVATGADVHMSVTPVVTRWLASISR